MLFTFYSDDSRPMDGSIRIDLKGNSNEGEVTFYWKSAFGEQIIL